MMNLEKNIRCFFVNKLAFTLKTALAKTAGFQRWGRRFQLGFSSSFSTIRSSTIFKVGSLTLFRA